MFVIALILVMVSATAAFLIFSPEVAGFAPQDTTQDLPTSTGFEITFSRQMNPDTVRERLSITPGVAGNFEWRGQTLAFTPANPWPPGTEVTVTLAAGATSTLGLPTRNSLTFSFTVSPILLAYLWPVGDQANLYALDPISGNIRQWTASGGLLGFDVESGGRDIFYSANNLQGGSDLYTLDRFTAESQLLLDCGSNSCTSPRVSPLGRYLAFQVNDSEIWVYDIAGKSSQQVSAHRHSARLPAWGPDGRLSFYDSEDQGFYLTDIHGETIAFFENLTGETGAWSPRSMTFVATELFAETTDILRGPSGEVSNQDVDESELEPVRIAYGNLLSYNSETQGSIQLTVDDNVEDLSPAFSPNGNLLAFGRRYLDEYRWTPGRQVWVMDSDGTDLQQLTDAPNFEYTAFVWHPGGRQIAAVRFNTILLTEPTEIWLIGLDGEALRLIIGGFDPLWIP